MRIRVRDALIVALIGAWFGWAGWVSTTLWQINNRVTRVEATVCPPPAGDRLAGIRP